MRDGALARRKRERGAVLIVVALSLVALLGFAVLVVDYGTMWVARRQAQNAADAGALAAAIELAFGDPTDVTTAEAAAHAAVASNPVWPYPSGARTTSTFEVLAPADSGCATVGLPDDPCVRTNVYRNSEEGSDPLQMLLGPVVGVSEQGVRASATAKMLEGGNAVRCLKPWIVADKWLENDPDNVWDSLDEYNRWVKDGGNLVLQPDPRDEPIFGRPGFQAASDAGYILTVKEGDARETPKPGWAFAINLGISNSGGVAEGGDVYRDNIAQCVDDLFPGYPQRQITTISSFDDFRNACDPTPVTGDPYCVRAEMGLMQGPTRLGFDDMVDTDPDRATWNMGSGTCDINGDFNSRRLVPVATYMLEEFYARWAGAIAEGTVSNANQIPSNFPLRITNILGFYVRRVGMNRGSTTIEGCLTPIRGSGYTSGSSTSSFLRVVTLVR